MKSVNVTAFLFLAACLTVSLKSYSQEIEKKTYQTAFTTVTPIIDGLMDEDCWNLVEWGGGFIQSQPEENKPPSQETAFKILYDNNNLYVFIRAFDTEPGKISRIMSRRDNFDGDMVEINIDSYFDKQTAFSFTATAAGVKGDELVTEDGNNWDDSWNPVWYLATSSDSLGWCAEMRIPFSQIRFGKKTEHIWGLQVMRHIYRLSERSTWQYIPKGSPGSIHLFGELHGIKNIKPQHKAELLPYLVAKAERFGKVEGDPFLTGKSSSVNAGLDGKIALTNDFTLDFSINPDFGQVEADPSEVNLTAFETYFSERRPFFIEGKNIFQFMPNQTIVIHNMYSDNLFYSRRIGRYPQYYPSVSENVAVKMPESTTILGAMKISGKTKNGLSVGIMESLTANENAVTDSLGVRNKVSVEPLTNYFAGRIKKDFNKGETVLGGIITSVNRKITNPDLYFLNNSAYTAGLDFQHNWKDRTWYIAGNTEVSNINGKPEAITSEQTSSARYFQRPDASYLSVDSSRTSLSGYGATVKLGRSSKKKIQFETSVTLRSPGLEFNDIGYMRYSDIIHHGTWVAYYIRNPFAIFNNFYLNTNYWIYWNFGGKLLSTNANVNFNSQFKNRWRINGSFTRRSENISTNLLRGGPSFIMPGDQGMNLNLTTDQSRKFSAGGGFYTGSRDVKSRKENSFWGSLFYRPLNNLSFSVEPEYDITDDMLQYVTTAGPSGEPVYIFGELNQKTLSFTLRVNFTINPELSLEYYGQPFISAGKYSKFKKITMPHAGSFSERFHEYSINEIMYNGLDNTYSVSESGNTTADYSFGNPDYNFGQFRSNMVIRWEYTPGSTLFLVWSQGRTNSSARGLFSYTNDMKDLFNIVPRNIFLLKFSYWFSL